MQVKTSNSELSLEAVQLHLHTTTGVNKSHRLLARLGFVFVGILI